MKDFIITDELLDNYYNEHLLNDAKFSANYGCNYNHMCLYESQLCASTTAFAPENGLHISHRQRTRTISLMNEAIYLSFMAYMYALEDSLEYILGREVETDMNKSGFPWMPAVGRSLTSYVFENNICCKEDAEIIYKTLEVVKPFMAQKLIDITGLLNAEKTPTFINKLQERTNMELEHSMFQVRRNYFEYKGLVGIDVSKSKIKKYLDLCFNEHFKGYFPCATNESGYLETLFVNSNCYCLPRLEDGNPGTNPSENLMFVAILLYMYIAQQSILTVTKHSYDTVKLFHKYTGWPHISTGPGAGPYLHPLKMLEYAGLLPLKSETTLFSEVVTDVFWVLREELNSALNGRQKDKKNSVVYNQFISVIRQGRIKHDIKVYMDNETRNIQDLIIRWGESSTTSCWKFLEENGLKTMIPVA